MDPLQEFQITFQDLISKMEARLHESIADSDLFSAHGQGPRRTRPHDLAALRQQLKNRIQETVDESLRQPFKQWLTQCRKTLSDGVVSPEPFATPNATRTIGKSNQATTQVTAVESGEEASRAQGNPPYRLPVQAIGSEMVQSLSQIIQQRDFSGYIKISDFEDPKQTDFAAISTRVKSLRYKPRGWSVLAINYERFKRDSVKLYPLGDIRAWKFPDLTLPAQKPAKELQSYINQLLRSPPADTIPYYVGPPLTRHFNHLLDPGNLRTLGDLKGVNSIYWHAGEQNSGSAFHCEDASMRSCNLTIQGYKLWIMIQENSTTQFERFIKRTYAGPVPKCDQWIRHQCLLISPQRLEAEDIKFDLLCAGPGDLVVTGPRQYHAVVNLTTCFAISINFVLPDELPLALSKTCEECGLSSLSYPNISAIESGTGVRSREQNEMSAAAKLYGPVSMTTCASHVSPSDEHRDSQSSQPQAAMSEHSSVPTLQSSSSSVERDSTEERFPPYPISNANDPMPSASRSPQVPDHKRKAPDNLPAERTSKSPKMARNLERARIDIQRLVDAVQSRDAIRQFCDLVNTRREPSLEDSIRSSHSHFQRPPGVDLPTLSAARYLILLNRGQQTSKIMTRIHQYLLAKICADHKQGSLRLESDMKKNILRISGLSSHQYDWQVSRGKKWIRLCGEDFDGVLCFILAGRFNSFDIAPNRYLDLDDGQLQTFHQLLKKKSNYTTSICSTGKAFQESLRAEDIHFRWETPKLLPISDLEESTMLSYLKPFKPLRENRFDANNFPEPARNPTILSDTEKQCDFCNDTTCYCLLQRLPKYNIRIKRYHGKGLGLQAVSNQFGAIVFEAGTLLGFLTGRLVPPKTCNHDMAAAMDDCQLDCSEMGNCFRLLNHACPDHAVAGLKKRRVSGQKMLAVEALQDIRSGTEITIDYGLKSCHLDCHSCCG